MTASHGDTFEATDGNIRFRVRIAGMDAPEKGSPFSQLATVELNKRLEGTKDGAIYGPVPLARSFLTAK